MENLIQIVKRFHQLESEMLHGGYNGEMLEDHIINVISDEILSELGDIEKYEGVKRILINMFYLGRVINIS